MLFECFSNVFVMTEAYHVINVRLWPFSAGHLKKAFERRLGQNRLGQETRLEETWGEFEGRKNPSLPLHSLLSPGSSQPRWSQLIFGHQSMIYKETVTTIGH